VSVVVDAAPLVAVADEREPRRNEILAVLRSERGRLFIPAPVTAEIDYLLDRRFGPRARRAFIEDLAARRYETLALDVRDYAEALELDRRYADLDLGLADLSVAVLARKLGTRRILTFDERHFRAVRPLQGGTFTLLPADGQQER
jgi:predicted nucleic acid-binding protein